MNPKKSSQATITSKMEEKDALKEGEKNGKVVIVDNYIDGTWKKSTGTETVDVINPAYGTVIAKTPLGTAKDVDEAVKAAKEAFKIWRETPIVDRIQYLFKLKTLLEENADKIAKICTTENGKTFTEAKGDVRRGIQMVETACGMPSLLMGSSLEDIASGIDCVTIRRPMGVFAGITPFNFPPMVPFWFWPFAIACGNTFILKPSERVPLSQIKVFELIEKAGFPKGILNMVQGGKEVVDALCAHKDIKGISFVGSTPVAKHVYETATKTGKRVQALGGAKNFMVVLPDAIKDLAIRTVFESCTGCAGQRCLAGSVVLGVGKIYKELEEGIVKKAKNVTVGDGLDPKSNVGPLISKEAKERVSKLIDSAEKEGAKILVDGRKGVEDLPGYFIKPTVISGVRKDMKIAKEEIFGPVICLAEVKSLDESIEWLNSSNYGNTTSLFTTSGAAARKFCYEVDPSMIGINIGVPAPMSFFSFGGTKDSFFGDIKVHGKTCVDFFTDTKVSIQRWQKESSIW